MLSRTNRSRDLKNDPLTDNLLTNDPLKGPKK